MLLNLQIPRPLAPPPHTRWEGRQWYKNLHLTFMAEFLIFGGKCGGGWWEMHIKNKRGKTLEKKLEVVEFWRFSSILSIKLMSQGDKVIMADEQGYSRQGTEDVRVYIDSWEMAAPVFWIRSQNWQATLNCKTYASGYIVTPWITPESLKRSVRHAFYKEVPLSFIFFSINIFLFSTYCGPGIKSHLSLKYLQCARGQKYK